MELLIYSQQKTYKNAQKFASMLGLKPRIVKINESTPPVKEPTSFLFYLSGNEPQSLVSERMKEVAARRKYLQQAIFYLFKQPSLDEAAEWGRLLGRFFPERGAVYFDFHKLAKALHISVPQGERLDVSALRHALGLTQKQMAMASRVSERTIQYWEEYGPSTHGEKRLRDLIELHQTLGDYIKPGEIKIWLNSPNEAFEGKPPIDLILDGRPRDVLLEFRRLQTGEPF